MSKEMNVVLAQLNPALRNPSRNLEIINEIVSEHSYADLVVFPELFLSSYTVKKPEELAIDLNGPENHNIGRVADDNSTAIVYGAAERMPGGCANSAFCIDRFGEFVGAYRKTHLFGDETGAFVAGNELLIADINDVQVGIMVCFDVEFPEVARALALSGAELLVTISANMDPFGKDHRIFCTARALENGLPHLYVNQVGSGETFNFAGGSMIISADGNCLASAGDKDERVVSHRLILGVRDDGRPDELRPDYLSKVRPKLPVTTKISNYAGERDS